MLKWKKFCTLPSPFSRAHFRKDTSESREDSIEQGPVNHLDLDDEGDGVDNPGITTSVMKKKPFVILTATKLTLEGGFQDWADDMKLPLKALPHREAQDHEETEDVEEEAGVGHGDDHPSYVVVKQDGTDDEEDYVDITHGKA